MHAAIEKGLKAAIESDSASTWVLSNHDVPRVATRYALPQIKATRYHQIALDWLLRDGSSYDEDRELGERRARAALLLELALPGSAYVYQGEELGLFEVADIPWAALEDPTATNTHGPKAREGARRLSCAPAVGGSGRSRAGRIVWVFTGGRRCGAPSATACMVFRLRCR